MHHAITEISIAAPGTHEQHITHYWGAFGWKEKQQAVEEVWDGASRFYVASGLRQAECEAVPATRNASALLTLRPFLRTRPDGLLQNNLLSLPRRPAPGTSLYGMANALARAAR